VSRYLIDHKGKIWSHPAEGLGAALGYPNPDFDIWAYAIRNLGAVEVVCAADGLTVTMRTATAHAKAIHGAQQLLSTLEPQPVKLRYEIGTWIEETYDNPQQAAGRIESALHDAATTPNRVAFMSSPRKLAPLSEHRLNRIETADEKLGLMFKKWRLSQGRFDPETAAFLVRFGLFERTAVVTEKDTSGELVIEHVGAAFKLYTRYDDAWPLTASGNKLADQPDPDYGRWVDRTYRGVLDERQPRFEYVDAVIQARGAEPYRSRYDRLLLPWQDKQGARIVTGTSYQTAQTSAAH
jgi:hypothetical protein